MAVFTRVAHAVWDAEAAGVCFAFVGDAIAVAVGTGAIGDFADVQCGVEVAVAQAGEAEANHDDESVEEFIA